MKSKKLISTILALLLALQCIAPALASETDVPPETGETAEETLPPETPEEVLPEMPPEVLPEDPVPQEPEETQPPEDTQEPGEVQEPEDTLPPDAVQDQPEGEPNPEDVPDAAEEPADPDAVPLEDLIDVLVPSTGQMILNPYRLPVDLEGGETTDQIIHSCQTLINQSGFPVTVNVTVTGTVPAESEAAFVSEPPSPDTPDKEVFLYAEFQDQPDWWEGRFDDLPNQVLVSERGDAKEEVLTLDTQGEGYFRLFGEMAEAPEEMWSKTDVFGAVLAFTFTPVDTDPAQIEEPEAPETPEAPPEEELPEDPETPDTPGEVPPTEPEDPEPPEAIPPEDPVTPDTPEEIPPEEIPPEEPENPAPPEETSPESPEEPEAPEETPPEGSETPDVPTEPEAPAEPNATLPAVQDNE